MNFVYRESVILFPRAILRGRHGVAINSDSARSGSAEASEAFDLHHLNKSTFGSRELALEVLALFDRQAERLLVDVADAPDAATRRIAAHTLKGAALGVGALGVAAAAEEIERGIEDPVEAIGAVARLSARITEARLAVAALID